MKVAGITCFYNDYEKIDQFEEFYREYEKELKVHVIVDNGSRRDFREDLRSRFTGRSVLIFLKKNSGTTGAYNAAFRYLLQNTDCDAFMIIANDVRIEPGTVEILHRILNGDPETGVVGPVLLKKGNSNEIEEYGGMIDPETVLVNKRYYDRLLDENLPVTLEVSFIAGGINMAKREVYDRSGLQDESLFMYGDEVDWDIRVKKAGYKLVVTREAKAWHEHINSVNTGNSEFRDPLYYYYFFRNRILLARKYGTWNGLKKTIYDTDDYLRARGLNMLKNKKFREFLAIHLGALTGLLGWKIRLF